VAVAVARGRVPAVSCAKGGEEEVGTAQHGANTRRSAPAHFHKVCGANGCPALPAADRLRLVRSATSHAQPRLVTLPHTARCTRKVSPASSVQRQQPMPHLSVPQHCVLLTAALGTALAAAAAARAAAALARLRVALLLVLLLSRAAIARGLLGPSDTDTRGPLIHTPRGRVAVLEALFVSGW
jgi:hypothetical protein